MYIHTYKQHDPQGLCTTPDEKDTFLNDRRLTLHSFKNKNKNKKKMFFLFLFLFLEFQETVDS
jgi:hypothetical protein